MVFTGGSNVRLFYLKLLLLIGTHIPLPNGQRLVDISLQLQGVFFSSDSLVDIDDILQLPESSNATPANNNEYHNQSLLCLTDLDDCCSNPRTRRGNWYYPNGNEVMPDSGGATFRRNRGANEVINNQQFYGSVRLWRRGDPPERGRFRCELPNSANPFVNRVLYAHILDIGAVTISVSGSSIAGRDSFLVCSATITTQSDTPRPHFQWFFGTHNNSLPFQTPMTTNSGDVYTSTLQFSPLSQSHAGMYTCRLGGNVRLAARSTLIINAPPITVMITANFNAPLMVGQTGSILTCDVSGADNINPTLTYQWTRNDGTTQTQVGNSSILPLSRLRLTDIGDYSCNITVNSTLLNNNVMAYADNSQRVIIQIPNPQSVTVTSSLGTIIPSGSDVTINCTVELGSAVMESDLSMLIVDAQLSRDGVLLPQANLTASGTTFILTTQLNSFGRNDSGNYTCTATVRPQPTSSYLTGMGVVSDTARITIGVFCSIQSRKVGNNSYLLITDIGEGDYGALLCYTDNTHCCQDSDTQTGQSLGQWFYPNGSPVGTKNDGQNFYVDRGPSVVRLNRRSNTTSIKGWFCCEVPDAASVNMRVCVNIVVPSVFMTTCVSEVAIGVVVTIVFECLLAVPIIAAVVLAFCHRKKRGTSENTHDGGSVRAIYYEEPDQMGAAITPEPRNFELTKCPAYISTTNEAQPHQPTQSGEYEYIANDSRVTSC